jgi:ferritin
MVGAKKYFRKQYMEELGHLTKVMDYMADRNVSSKVCHLELEDATYTDILSLLKASLKHEELVTNTWNETYTICIEEGDNVTAQLAHWYLQEQVEEEDRVQTLIDRLETYGNGLDIQLLVDTEMGEL